MDIAGFLVALTAILIAAKLFGEIAERLGQPAVLGELVGGVILGVSGLRLIDPHQETIHLLSELGVVLLLFMIGLETDLKKLLAVGGSATAVAFVGVAIPFLLGFLVGRLLDYSTLLSIFLGAALTATSVGITARVLSDLGHLQSRESQVILGAAVIDDILGLIILSVVSGLAAGEKLSVLSIIRTSVVAFGFVALALAVGSRLAPFLMRVIARVHVAKALLFSAMVFAFTLAFLAEKAGSALIVGAFAAGLVLTRTEKGPQIQAEVHDLAQFFIPIFFVSVGAAVDLRTLNPLDPQSRGFLFIGILLTAVAILGKALAGFAAFGKGIRKTVVGIGMIPRGEVGLIFATIGLSSGLLSSGLFSSVAMMVMVTTFVTPPLLRVVLRGKAGGGQAAVSTVAQIITEAPSDDRTPSRAQLRGTPSAGEDPT
jgi:Kef-type K+ transport system membrane component KefB